MESQSQHIVYLTSASCNDIFPRNTAHSFENAIQTLNLDPKLHYEVGMANILLPSRYYILRENELDHGIKITVTRTNQSPTEGIPSVPKFEEMCLPLTSVLGPEKSVGTILSAANSMLVPSLIRAVNFCYGKDASETTHINPKTEFFNEDPIQLDENSEKCRLFKRQIRDHRIYADSCHISITFAHGIARMLGFESGKPYMLFELHKTFTSTRDYYYGGPSPKGRALHLLRFLPVNALNNPRTDGGVDYLFVYSDLCTRSRFGSHMVNILGAFAVGNSTSLGFNPTVYHQINSHKINTIAIRIADQDGKPIVFDPNHTVTVALHFRPK